MRGATCRRGVHPSTPENIYTGPSGASYCRPCAAEAARARRAGDVPPLPALRPPAWMDDALCAQADPDAWFPEDGGPATAARRICGSCLVRAECLDYALGRREQHGIWGGLNTDQRRQLARDRERAAREEATADYADAAA